MIDLDKLSLAELRTLKTHVESEIKRRGTSSRKLVRKLERLATSQGLSLNELLSLAGKAEESAPLSSQPKPIKYRNPNVPTQGWSGIGRKPSWVIEFLASGGNIDRLAV